MMRVLFCSAPLVGLMGDLGGVRKQMLLYEDALKTRGQEVGWLPSQIPPDWDAYDLCHLFMANGDSFSIGVEAHRHLPLVVSPIIDKLFAPILMRLNVTLSRYLPVFYTHLGKCATLCGIAQALCLMSSHEARLVTHGLGVRTPATVVRTAVSAQLNESQPGRFADYTEKPYILFLGDAGNPRKNVKRLIQAVGNLDIQLLIGGMVSPGETGRAVLALARETPNVRLIGVVTEEEKAFLLTQARALVLPSLMEGIGLAAIEAALRGTTVVITDRGGPPDYFGDRAYYVSPRSTNDIHDKIKAALAVPIDASKHIQQICSLAAACKGLETCYQTALSRRDHETGTTNAYP